jgi:hypothetical protein
VLARRRFLLAGATLVAGCRRGRTSPGLLRAIRARYPRVHLLTRVTSVDFPTSTVAHVALTVAAAAHPLPSVADVARVTAEILFFELTFDEAAARWLVTAAVWQPGELRDFLDDRADRAR